MKKMFTFCFLFFLCMTLQAGEYDSALAELPLLITEPYSSSVEEILIKVAANAPATGGFSAKVKCLVEKEKSHRAAARLCGPFLTKYYHKWNSAEQEILIRNGEYLIEGKGSDWRVEKTEDVKGAAFSWYNTDGNIFSQSYSDSWPVIWRLHYDALETNLLSWCEGTGLIFITFNPAEYLRRAENLETGKDCEVNGKIYTTLIATPEWIRKSRSFKSLDAISRMSTWANRKPVVRYFIDKDTGVVAGAEFTFYKVVSNQTDETFKTEAVSTGLKIECFASSFIKTGDSFIPERITGTISIQDEVLRKINLQIQYGIAPNGITPLTLPDDKLIVNPWPQYRASVYESVLGTENETFGDLLGFTKALCSEGDIKTGELLLFQIAKAVEADKNFSGAKPGGLDWEAGEALSSLFYRSSIEEIESLWDRIPRNSVWFEITARGIRLYQVRHVKDGEAIKLLFVRFEETFENPRRAQLDREAWLKYKSSLESRIEKAQSEGDSEGKEYFEKLLAEVNQKIAAL